MKTYSTRRLILRRLSKRDYKAWLRSQELCFPKMNKFDKDPLPRHRRSKAVFYKAVSEHRKLSGRDEAYIWNIFLKSTGELVGWVDLSTIARGNYQLANIGYFIINSYRRRGYAEEAVKKITRAAFRDLKFHRLEAITDLDNKPSIKFAKKCGFKSEGIRKYYWFQNGRWEDQVALVLTPEMI